MGTTLKDIALRVGKSVTTVSRALNDYDDVGPETKAEIVRVASEMGYSPNTLAQRLQKRRTDTIGFIIPPTPSRSTDPFFSDLLTAIGYKASQTGYDLLVSTHPNDGDEISAYRKMLEGRQVDGFIVVRTRKSDLRIEYLHSRNFPFVSYGKTNSGIDHSFVDVDGELGMRLIAEYLISLGHKRIACIVPDPVYSFANCRLKGFSDYLNEKGIALTEAFIRIGALDQSSGYEQGKILLDLPQPPTAIVACNDVMAFGVYRAAQERGLVVGQDICITGFDDIPLAEHANPPLTTIHQPVREIGSILFEILIRLIRMEISYPEQVIMEPRLVIRQSCGRCNE